MASESHGKKPTHADVSALAWRSANPVGCFSDGVRGVRRGGETNVRSTVSQNGCSGASATACEKAFSFLNRELQQHVSNVSVTGDRWRVVRGCLEQLKKTLGRDWQVQPFGSFANGLCTETSDLDVTCYQEEQLSGQSNSADDMQYRLIPALQGSYCFQVLEVIRAARVPIVKLRFDNKLEVDLSCNNKEPLANTQLLHAYTKLHPVVRHLAVAVKLWAAGVGVCGAREKHLSSYSLTLMVIYFLQVDPGVAMPCLPTQVFDGGQGTPPAVEQVTWSCSSSLVSLLFRFFTFFAFDFGWGTEVVAVRLGARTSRTDPAHSSLRGCWGCRLHIADPFLLERNLNCVLGPVQEQTLQSRIHEAARALQNGVLPPGLGRANMNSGTKVGKMTRAGEVRLVGLGAGAGFGGSRRVVVGWGGSDAGDDASTESGRASTQQDDDDGSSVHVAANRSSSDASHIDTVTGLSAGSGGRGADCRTPEGEEDGSLSLAGNPAADTERSGPARRLQAPPLPRGVLGAHPQSSSPQLRPCISPPPHSPPPLPLRVAPAPESVPPTLLQPVWKF